MARPVVYAELAEQIRQSVLTYHDGWEIPSIRDLGRLHQASPHTVHKALQVLIRQRDIRSSGPACRYVRCRSDNGPVFCKPYPSVALMTTGAIPFAPGAPYTDYLSSLLGGLCESLRNRDIPITLLPGPDRLGISAVPGGGSVRQVGLCFSAIVFLSGTSESTLTTLVESQAVVMVLDCLTDMPGVDCVAVDIEAEAQLIVEHLAKLGHRRIAFVAGRFAKGPSHWQEGIDPDAARFSLAMFRAKRMLGLDMSPALHHYHMPDRSPSRAEVRLTVDTVLRHVPAPTAIVFFDLAATIPARQVLHEHGLRCPEDMSIVGRTCTGPNVPACTCLVSDPHGMGMAAAGQILDRLTYMNCPARKLQFPSALMEGPSTGVAPQATWANVAGQHVPARHVRGERF